MSLPFFMSSSGVIERNLFLVVFLFLEVSETLKATVDDISLYVLFSNGQTF